MDLKAEKQPLFCGRKSIFAACFFHEHKYLI